MIFASDGRVPGDAKDHLFIAFNRGGGWQSPQPIRYAGDDAGGYSADNEPHLSHDLHTLYFSSDRVTRAQFPRTPEQAQQDLERLDSWDNTNANAWSVPIGPRPGTALTTGEALSAPGAEPAMVMPNPIWLAAGVRTPFAKVDGALANYDAIELSIPVVRP